MDGECPTCGRPLGDLDADGKMQRNPKSTSRKAAVEVRHKSGRYDVLVALMEKPRTADGVSAIIGVSPNQVATRLQELREGGFARYTKRGDPPRLQRRYTRKGCLALIQEITENGRKVVEDLDRQNGWEPEEDE